jgi:intein/homing endonuclease
MNKMTLSSENTLISVSVAEILGAFTGDGWIESDRDALYICGNPVEDRDYYDSYLAPLFSDCFTCVRPKEFPYWRVYGIVTYKRDVIRRAIELGFQKGPKALIAEIPQKILLSCDKEVQKAFLRGLFDADGSFWCEKSNSATSTGWKRTHNHHPELRLTSCSPKLLNQVRSILNRFNIDSKIVQKSVNGVKHGRNVHDSYALNIRKLSEIEKWFDIIGTNNPRLKTKYAVWKKWGYLPPRMTIKERLAVLAA